MIQKDRIAEIETFTVKEFKFAIIDAVENLQRGNKPVNALELLAAAPNIGLLGEDLKIAFERWLQLDLWETVDNKDNKEPSSGE